MNAVATQSKAQTIEQVLIGGNLNALTAEQRVDYYNKLCQSLSLNPLTQPFLYLTLNGKLVLYATRACGDQLRKINGVSIEIVSKTLDDGLMTVHVRARDKEGRTDEDFGVVNIGTLKGESAANAMLKCVTKAKRRVTLSISGLGFLDETEVDDIPASAKGQTLQQGRIVPPAAPKPNGIPIVSQADNAVLSEADERALDRASYRDMAHEKPEHDAETGEIADDSFDDENLSGEDAGWKKWGDEAIAAFAAAKTAMGLSKLLQKNVEPLERCKDASPRTYDRAMAEYRKRATFLSGQPLTPPDELPEFLRR